MIDSKEGSSLYNYSMLTTRRGCNNRVNQQQRQHHQRITKKDFFQLVIFFAMLLFCMGGIYDYSSIRKLVLEHQEEIQFELLGHGLSPVAGLLEVGDDDKGSRRIHDHVCSLQPAWGATGDGNNGGEEVCVGSKPSTPYTTATHLTCPGNIAGVLEGGLLPPRRTRHQHAVSLTSRGNLLVPTTTAAAAAAAAGSNRTIVSDEDSFTNHDVIETHSNKKVIIALLYYAKPSGLIDQFKMFDSYPEEVKERLTILIIDDGSPIGLRASEYFDPSNDSSTLPLQLQFQSLPEIKIARITEDIPWNIGGARNLAFELIASYMSPQSKVLMLDLDMFVDGDTMSKIFALPTTVRSGPEQETKEEEDKFRIAHKFNRIFESGRKQEHAAITLINADTYWRIGGCDEDFVGNYG